MPGYTRRDLLARALPGLALAALLPACGRPDAPATPTAIPQRAAAPTGTLAPATPRTAATPSPATPARAPVAATPPLPTPTPTLSAAAPVFLGREPCPGYTWHPTAKPEDPYFGGAIAEPAATPFSEKVRRFADLIVLGIVRDILPARWATADGRRPASPHGQEAVLIYTPIRVEVERVAKGRYPLPDIHFAEAGGRIGQDCAYYSGSGSWPEFTFGGRFLYLVVASSVTQALPVPEDSRYRHYHAFASYAVNAGGMVTIGPEWDIRGTHYDDPPRTLTVDEVFREIAALLAAPGATPTR